VCSIGPSRLVVYILKCEFVCVQVNFSSLVPPIVLFLNKHPMAAAADLSSLTRLVSAAAPIGKEVIEEFNSKHKNCTLGQGIR